MKPKLGTAFIALFGLANFPAGAAEGALLAQACTSCHGLRGEGGEAIPPIAGIPEDELLRRLKELGQPSESATIMPRLLRVYSDEELAALAAYFAGARR